jgi:phosphate uptake regulator
MDARKLQKTGGSTFTLSLPKKWVVGSGLKSGDAVFIEAVADGSLVLRPTPGASGAPRTKVLAATEKESRDHLLRKLIGAYIAGYDVIELRFKSEAAQPVRRVAREFTRMVIGPEILEEGRNSLVLQDLSDPREMNAEKCLRRMYMTVRSMHEDALTVVRTRDPALAKDVEQRDEDVDRLYWMVAKQYSLAHLAGPSAAEWTTSGIHDFTIVAKLLERIGDHAERMARAGLDLTADLEPRLLKDLQAASRASLDVLDRAFTALMGGDLDGANEAVDGLAPIQKQADALAHRVGTHKGQELLALGAIVDSICRAAGYATDIAEIAINHVLGKE